MTNTNDSHLLPTATTMEKLRPDIKKLAWARVEIE